MFKGKVRQQQTFQRKGIEIERLKLSIQSQLLSSITRVLQSAKIGIRSASIKPTFDSYKNGFLVMKFTEVGCNEVIPPYCKSNEGKYCRPTKDPQGKVRRGELLKTTWPQHSIHKISAHRKFLSFTF